MKNEELDIQHSTFYIKHYEKTPFINSIILHLNVRFCSGGNDFGRMAYC